jgi:hypothetical protein
MAVGMRRSAVGLEHMSPRRVLEWARAAPLISADQAATGLRSVDRPAGTHAWAVRLAPVRSSAVMVARTSAVRDQAVVLASAAARRGSAARAAAVTWAVARKWVAAWVVEVGADQVVTAARIADPHAK